MNDNFPDDHSREVSKKMTMPIKPVFIIGNKSKTLAGLSWELKGQGVEKLLCLIKLKGFKIDPTLW